MAGGNHKGTSTEKYNHFLRKKNLFLFKIEAPKFPSNKHKNTTIHLE